ncbi:MAG: hypothetical protein FWE26_03335 [Coriobacteriia bacterium]|nr:hypothetical protein [Coriobacteriia bacterium]
MKIATVKASGKVIDFKDNVFLIDGQSAAKSRIEEYDRLGVLEWANSEVRDYALSSQSATVAVNTRHAPLGTTIETGSSDAAWSKYIVIAITVIVIGVVGAFAISWYIDEQSIQTGHVVEVFSHDRSTGNRYVIVSDNNSNRGHLARTHRDVSVGDTVRFRLQDDSARRASMGLTDITIISVR